MPSAIVKLFQSVLHQNNWKIIEIAFVSGYTFEKSQKFMKISTFLVSLKNLSLARTLPQGIEWTQRMHFWIGIDLLYPEKLFRIQLNSQILRYLHFSGQNAQKILGPS